MGTTLTGHLIGHSFKEMSWHRSPGWFSWHISKSRKVWWSSVPPAFARLWLLVVATIIKNRMQRQKRRKGVSSESSIVRRSLRYWIQLCHFPDEANETQRVWELSTVGQICDHSGNYFEKRKNKLIIQETCCKVPFCCIQGALSSRFRKFCVT